MNEQNALITLTKSTIGGEEVNTIDARWLYEKFPIKTRFNDYIKIFIDHYELLEGRDYEKNSYYFLSNNKMMPIIDYRLSLFTAKLFATIQKSPEGKRIRDLIEEKEQELIDSMRKIQESQIAYLNQENTSLKELSCNLKTENINLQETNNSLMEKNELLFQVEMDQNERQQVLLNMVNENEANNKQLLDYANKQNNIIFRQKDEIKTLKEEVSSLKKRR